MATAVFVEHVSKSYRLGIIGSDTIREDLARWWARMRGRRDPFLQVGADHEHHDRQVGKTFWALDDVNFELNEGEVLGVIGRNGAGKSTLLKILSQVTAPSAGRVTIRGRVASLLEVGTGFHPDLTGRENVFLNGAILGMTKSEIRRNFDEIVAFSECDTFIDTPVKRYSSGMYVRLAFAVAAHLESEILIVDEVLAVGDAQFQKKCLGKIRDVSTHGRTILFVTHSMSAVAALCGQAVLLRGGRLVMHDQTSRVITEYQSERGTTNAPADMADKSRPGSGKARFRSLDVRAVDAGGQPLRFATPGCDLVIDTEVECINDFADANVAVTVFDGTGYRVVDINTALCGEFLSLRRGQRVTLRFRVTDLLLKPGPYSLHLWIGRGGIETIDYVEAAGTLEIVPDPSSARHTETFPGVYQPRFTHEWLT